MHTHTLHTYSSNTYTTHL